MHSHARWWTTGQYLGQAHLLAQVQQEWERCAVACLLLLAVDGAEVDRWRDDLHPVFEAVTPGLIKVKHGCCDGRSMGALIADPSGESV